MIKILGNIISLNSIAEKVPANSIELVVASRMISNNNTFYYSNINELLFEIDLRSRIIYASRELNKNKLVFSTFRESRCNPMFWKRTEEGGFLLKNDVMPSAAINDIYNNTYMYRTECATAIIIVFYRAIVKKLSEYRFNKMFSNIYLMNWKQLDSDLGVRTHSNVLASIPGDCMYFKNPEVDPLKMEWQGENAIDLGDGTYYGHGIGITTADRIIDALNSKRKAGATKSAYLLDTATRLGFRHLAELHYLERY